MIVFISGGCKNGKSSIAEKICLNLSKGDKLHYIATMIPCDEEDYIRIKRHKEERKDYNFHTIEVSKDFNAIKDFGDTYLLDSLTAFTLNHIIDKDENMNVDIITNDINTQIDKLIKNVKNIVIVSDYITSENINTINKYSDKYMQILSNAEKHIAKFADVVLEVSFSNVTFYKGEEHEGEIFYTI